MTNLKNITGKKIPKLRFSGFDGEWEEKKLGEMYVFKNGINASKEQYGKGIKFINVLDIIENRFITYENIIGKVDVSQREIENNNVSYGDVLFQRSSETREEVGQANVYLDGENEAVFGGFVIRGKCKNDNNPIFINYILKTNLVRKDVTSRGGGSTRYNIGQDSLSNVGLIIPKPNEQQKISSFLSDVDEKIEKIKERKNLLESYKKGVMQKIFSQEVRFKDENGEEFGEWKEQKMGDVCEFDFGKRITKTKNRGILYPVYGGGGESFRTDNFTHESELVVSRFAMSIKCLNRVKGKFWLLDSGGVIKTSNNKEFINYFLINNERKVYLCGRGVAQKNLDQKLFFNIDIDLPPLKEQEKIADFLFGIDEKIEKVNEELEESESFKKGLLQSLFV